MGERVRPVDENRRFTGNLATIADVLQKYNVSYSMVGGFARDAITNGVVTPRRKGGTVRDFDAVALGPDETTIAKAVKELEAKSVKDPLFPSVGIESAVFSDRPVPYHGHVALSTLRKNSKGQFYLVYRDIEVPIAPETMETQITELNGVPFPVFSPKTIYMRYWIRGGFLKPKDYDKVLELHMHIINSGIASPPDELYAPYIDFVRQIQTKYSSFLFWHRLYWTADYATGSRFSGSKLTQPLKNLFREKGNLSAV